MRRFSSPTSGTETVLPRALVHRGTVEAAAILVSPRLLGGEQAQQRVLALWESGSALHEIDGDWLLIFASPRRLHFDAAPGLPLIRDGDFLFAAPFDEAEKSALQARFAGVSAQVLVTLQNSAANARVLASETRRDPASWLHLESFSLIEGHSLGAAPPQAELALAPREFAARERLAGVSADDKLKKCWKLCNGHALKIARAMPPLVR